MLIHLAVGDTDAGLGHEADELEVQVVDGANAVVQEIDLPLAIEFAKNRLAHDVIAVLGDDGLDGQALDRRGLDDAQVLRAGKAHVERTRNRRGGHGEHVDKLAQMFEALFLLHAKTLFFVKDDEAEIAKAHVL